MANLKFGGNEQEEMLLSVRATTLARDLSAKSECSVEEIVERALAYGLKLLLIEKYRNKKR
jgi:hypothetical protein